MKYIIGIGSHSEVIYSIFKHAGDDSRFLSYPSSVDTKTLSGVIADKYAGGLTEHLESKSSKADDTFIIGIGDNKMREEIARKYTQLVYINAIHPKVTIIDEGKTFKIGVGNVICPGVVIQTGVVIGNHNIINTNASVDHHNNIGSYCHLAPNTAICGNVTIYDGVFIGVGSSVVPKVKIGAWQFIKANTLVKDSSSPVNMYEPYLARYKVSAMEALESGWVSSMGKYVPLATDKIKSVLATKHAILVNNGTSATHCLFLALKFKHPEVKTIYVPNNVYVAAWNCALMVYPQSSIKLLSMNPKTWNMNTDEKYIKSLDKSSAVLIVHNLGNVINVPRLKRIRPDLIFIEDNCEGLFGKYEGKFTGSSDSTLCSSVSFFGNKTITSGEGGAVFTQDDKVYEFLAKTCNQGTTAVRYVHDTLGYNYRMTNIQAALLLDQLNDIEHILSLKKQVFSIYEKAFRSDEKSPSTQIQEIEPDTQRANWIFGVRVVNSQSFDQLSNYMKSKGIDVRPMFYPIETHGHLSFIKDTNNTLNNKEIVMLPSYPLLPAKLQEFIVSTLLDYIAKHITK